MKKLLLYLFAFGVLVANAQTTTADTVNARKKIKLNGYGVSNFDNDTAMAAHSPYALPTQYAVYSYITNHAPGSQNFANTDLRQTDYRYYNGAGFATTMDSIGLNVYDYSSYGHLLYSQNPNNSARGIVSVSPGFAGLYSFSPQYNASFYADKGWVSDIYNNPLGSSGSTVGMGIYHNNNSAENTAIGIWADSSRSNNPVNGLGIANGIAVWPDHTEIGFKYKDNRIGAQPAATTDSIAGFIGDKIVRIPATALTISSTDALAEGSANYWWKNTYASSGYGLYNTLNFNGKDFSYKVDTSLITTRLWHKKGVDSLGALIASNTTAIAGKYGATDTTYTLSTKQNAWKVRDSLLGSLNTWQQTQYIATAIIGGGTPTGSALSNLNPLKVVRNSTTGLFGLQNLNDTGYAGYDFYKKDGSFALTMGYANILASAHPDTVYISSTGRPIVFYNNANTPKMVLAQAGLRLNYFTTNNGLLYTNASGDVQQSAAGTATQVYHGAGTGFGAVNLATETSGTLPTTSLPFTFVDSTNQPYRGLITWTGSQSPGGTPSLTYNAIVFANCVDLQINLSYTTPGTAITRVDLTLPSWLPTPVVPPGFSATGSPLTTINFITQTATGSFNQTSPSGTLALGTPSKIQVYTSSQNLLGIIVKVRYFTN